MTKTQIVLDYAKKFNIPVKFITIHDEFDFTLNNGRKLNEKQYLGYCVISAHDGQVISSAEYNEYAEKLAGKQ